MHGGSRKWFPERLSRSQHREHINQPCKPHRPGPFRCRGLLLSGGSLVSSNGPGIDGDNVTLASTDRYRLAEPSGGRDRPGAGGTGNPISRHRRSIRLMPRTPLSVGRVTVLRAATPFLPCHHHETLLARCHRTLRAPAEESEAPRRRDAGYRPAQPSMSAEVTPGCRLGRPGAAEVESEGRLKSDLAPQSCPSG